MVLNPIINKTFESLLYLHRTHSDSVLATYFLFFFSFLDTLIASQLVVNNLFSLLLRRQMSSDQLPSVSESVVSPCSDTSTTDADNIS